MRAKLLYTCIFVILLSGFSVQSLAVEVLENKDADRKAIYPVRYTEFEVLCLTEVCL